MEKLILLPKKPGFLEEVAAEFNLYWNKMTGASLQIADAPAKSHELIVFGTDAENPLVHRMMLSGVLPELSLRKGMDEYRLYSFQQGSQNGLLIMAGSVRAYFYAVYDFFERNGCRYFWDGDRIPRKKTIGLTGYDVYETPSFNYRGIRYFAHRGLHRFQAEHWSFDDWRHEIDWALKKRLNLVCIRTGVEDLFQRAFPDVVKYPKFGEKAPEWQRNSHLDRTPFWKLEFQGKMLEKVYSYAKSRGLMLPTDCGTLTHWYSFTPPEFLDKVKPGFIPEQVRYKGRPEGRVWDVDKPQNMENYWKLSEVQLKEYGTSELFHTIGLAERHCFPEHRRNHYYKKYVFGKIEEQLRRHYPNAPLLFSTWDFITTWNRKEIRDFVNGLNPDNTLLLDYTSDIYREDNNFLNWDIVGKFPWIYGIFHAYEASSEIRGDYDNIARRFPVAASDPMCKGMVFWPETSHSDTLKLEYFSHLAWTRKAIDIEDFIPVFCANRYPKASARKMEAIWLSALPLINAALWGEAGPMAGEPIREVYPAMYFQLLNRGSYCWSLGELDEERQEYHRHTVKMLSPLLHNATDVLKKLSAIDSKDEYLCRDCLDLARTIAIRVLDYALASFALRLETWQLYPIQENASTLRALVKDITRISSLFTAILSASEEYSLYYTMEGLKKVTEVNPVFEDAFKRNAVSPYCRSFVAEVAAYCYEMEWRYIAEKAEHCLAENDTRPWRGMLTEFEAADKDITEAFALRTLAEMRPDVAAAMRQLPSVLNELARIVSGLADKEVPYVIF